MSEGISLREFGRQLDVTAEAVRKAIATGKIPSDCIGETVLSSGRTRPCIIDPKRAAEHWGKNRDPNQVRDKATMSAGAKRGWQQRRGEEPDHEADEADAEPAAPGLSAGAGAGSQVPGLPSIQDSKRRTEAYKAMQARLDYEERLGRLVNADQVKVRFVNMVASARNKLLGVPSKAKGQIPHLTVRDIEILEDLIATALEEVAADG